LASRATLWPKSLHPPWADAAPVNTSIVAITMLTAINTTMRFIRYLL
jgi:hypothetical protein